MTLPVPLHSAGSTVDGSLVMAWFLLPSSPGYLRSMHSLIIRYLVSLQPIMDKLLFGASAMIHVLLLRRATTLGSASSTQKGNSLSSRLLELSIQGDLPQIVELVASYRGTQDGVALFINTQDKAGNAAIHGAVFGGHLEVVEYLLSNGASVDLINGLGCSPVWLAAGYNHKAILKILLEFGGASLLMTPNRHGDSPLIAAASKGHADVCKQILELAEKNGIRKSLKCVMNQSSDTALSVAVGAGIEDADLIALLCDASILDHVNSKGLSPLVIACERDLAVAAQTLIDSGANTLIKDAMGYSILVVASFCGSSRVVNLLLAQSDAAHSNNREQRINAQSEESGCTPLWLATRAGHVDCVRQLIAAGADTTIASRHGLTPLQVARKYQRAELVELLSA
jgi:ankyrin repeat protein